MFPRLGHFLFWLLWPHIVARQTESHYLKYTGLVMPPEQVAQLKTSLQTINPRKVKTS